MGHGNSQNDLGSTAEVEIYEGSGEPVSHALTVNKGTGGGKYAAGTVVGIVADTPGQDQVFAQ